MTTVTPFKALAASSLALAALASTLVVGTPQLSAAPTQTGGSISVSVFEDFNANGARNTTGDVASPAVDRGVPGLTVSAVCLTDNGVDGVNGTADDASYSAPVPATADGAGLYNFANLPGSPCRIEVSGLPAGYSAAPLGIDNGGLVQFAGAGAGATVSVGVMKPDHFCQNNPSLAVPCFTFGDPINGANAGFSAVRSFPYFASGSLWGGPTPTATPTKLAGSEVVGTLFGIEYNRTKGELYGAAFTKVYAGYGTGGAGAVYSIDPSGGGASLLATIPNAGSLPNRDGFAPNSNAVAGEWLGDSVNWDAVGKLGLGDIELTADDSILWVVNLNDRKIYPVNTATKVVGAGVAVPDTSTSAAPCAPDHVRPFGLGSDESSMYLGIVCAGPVTADLHAYVYRFNNASGAFSAAPVFDMALTYTHGMAGNGCGPDPQTGNWLPWADRNVYDGSSAPTFCSYPQAMLSDIEFDDNGDMILGFRDRFGDQAGEDVAAGPFGGGGEGVIAGDLLRACRSGSGWVLEDNASCGGALGSGENDGQGPGGGEFYSDSFGRVSGGVGGSDEITLGGVDKVPGFTDTVYTVTEPSTVNVEDWRAGGVRHSDNADGVVTNFFELYDKCDSSGLECPPGRTQSLTFGKVNGLGDIVALCDRAPVEIGNRVWLDANRNGRQDPGENPLSGVAVTLTIGTATHTATTGPNGVYVFSSDSRSTVERGTAGSGGIYGISALTAGASVVLSVPTSVVRSGVTHTLTVANIGSDSTDSDAVVASGKTAPIVIGAPGRNDHTWDFGFVPVQPIDLAITKRVSSRGPYRAGSLVTFDLSVVNNGPATAKAGFTVHDVLPTGLTFAGVATPAAGTGYTCAAPVGQKIVCTSNHALAALVGAAPIDHLTISARVATPAPAAGAKLKNVTWVVFAAAEVTEINSMSPTPPTSTTNTSTTPTNNDSEAFVTIDPPIPVYDLALVKTVTPGQTGAIGTNIVFVVTVANQGNVASGTVVVTDTLPAGTSFVSATGGGKHVAGVVTWNVANLAAGAKTSFALTLRVSESALRYRNWAEISSDSGVDEDSTPDKDTGLNGTPPNDEVVNHNDITKDRVAGDEDDNDFEDVTPALVNPPTA